MSKYKVVIRRSRMLYSVCWLICCLVCWSIYQWQPNIFVWQSLVQNIIVSVLICYTLYKTTNSLQPLSLSFVLSETGVCEFYNSKSIESWTICKDSRVTAWVIWLKLSASSSPTQVRWMFFLLDQIKHDDFCKISRVIRRKQQAS